MSERIRGALRNALYNIHVRILYYYTILLSKAHLPCAHPLKITFSRSSKFAYIDANSLLVIIMMMMMMMMMMMNVVVILRVCAFLERDCITEGRQ